MRINKKDVASVLIFIALILAFVLLINNITNKNSGRELQIVRDAVKNAALTCYAVEGMYPDESRMPQALKNRHMLFTEAAALARQAQTKRLLLTHFSTSMEDPEEYLPAARAVFERTWAAKDGETVVLRYPEYE